MKIALTVISRVNGIEIEKRYESEVMELFSFNPTAADYCDPVLEGFATLAKAHRDSEPPRHIPTNPAEAAQPHYIDPGVKLDGNERLK